MIVPAAIPRTDISIHALRGEGDVETSFVKWCRKNISIHALREEGDPFDSANP